VEALETRDGATLDRIMADDFIFMHPMEGDDEGQFIADVESGDVRVEHLGRENVAVRIFGDTQVSLGCLLIELRILKRDEREDDGLFVQLHPVYDIRRQYPHRSVHLF